MELTPKTVNDIHKRGGTILQTSRGGHDTNKIVDNIQDRGINQVDVISLHNKVGGKYVSLKELIKKLGVPGVHNWR